MVQGRESRPSGAAVDTPLDGPADVHTEAFVHDLDAGGFWVGMIVSLCLSFLYNFFLAGKRDAAVLRRFAARTAPTLKERGGTCL